MESLNTEGITFKKPSQNNKISRSGTSGKRKLDDPNSSKFVSDDINLDILRTFEEPSKTIPRRIELYNKNLELLKKNFKVKSWWYHFYARKIM
ncbi:hypothetical protein Ocin01_08498 [Orchesella cincta]|uniref:Uncharacterized protein n=1 Tax=Orchesella cincta TaxID=48709 RepID=A0A1D2MYU4_ORCCI|nr:hypothetical protein Ocin01_08498 [Orchesella cincta]